MIKPTKVIKSSIPYVQAWLTLKAMGGSFMKKDGLGFERLLIFLTGLNLILRIVLYVQEKRAANEKD